MFSFFSLRLLGIFWKCARIGKSMFSLSFFLQTNCVNGAALNLNFFSPQVNERVPGWPAAASSWLLVYFSYSSYQKKTTGGNMGGNAADNKARTV